MSDARPTIVQLCDDAFLKQLSPEFKDRVNFLTWRKAFGAKDNLASLPSNFYAGVVVDQQLAYSKSNLLAWVRILQAGGLLILEAGDYYEDYLFIVNACENALVFHPEKDRNLWVFMKKTAVSTKDIIEQVLALHRAKVSDNQLLAELDRLEALENQGGKILLIMLERLKIYQKYGLDSLIRATCQAFQDANASLDARMIALLSLLACGENFYFEAFNLRKSLVDRCDPREFRKSTPPAPELMNKRWNGEPLAGKVIVVWAEFGLGDEIMFAQLAAYFKQQNARKVVYLARAANLNLLRSSPDIDEVILETETPAELDYWVYPHDILAHIRTPFSQLPKRFPYLAASSQKIADFRPHFAQAKTVKIGIVWRGNPTHENDQLRSIHDLAYLTRLFDVPNIAWFSFQKDCRPEELALLDRYHIPDLGKHFGDFEDTAAAMAHLDYLVTVDTSCAHTAGAIGLPTFLLLPYVVDWRWGISGEANLWYPSFKAFRCNLPDPKGDWHAAITALTAHLQTLTPN